VAAVAQALVGTDFNLTADVSCNLAAKITFNLVVAFDEVTKCHELLVGEILDAGVRVHAGSSEGFVSTGLAHAVNVSESNFHALFAGNINSSETCHTGFSLLFSRGL